METTRYPRVLFCVAGTSCYVYIWGCHKWTMEVPQEESRVNLTRLRAGFGPSQVQNPTKELANQIYKADRFRNWAVLSLQEKSIDSVSVGSGSKNSVGRTKERARHVAVELGVNPKPCIRLPCWPGLCCLLTSLWSSEDTSRIYQ